MLFRSVHDHAGEGAALYVVRQNYGILLEVSPARVGSNEITLRFSDTVKNNARVRPLEVIVALSSPSAGIEPLRRRAKAIEEGAYRVELMPMPVQGTWRVEVEALIGDFEHPGLTVPLQVMGERRGVRVVVAPITEADDPVQALADALTPRTRLVALSHVI